MAALSCIITALSFIIATFIAPALVENSDGRIEAIMAALSRIMAARSCIIAVLS
jgi:hypothetical protein